eukprot:TRINITY_DN110614_c0_g1_i1.p1 TRINITY_DN110614_c0_g1~~TRINITY_DN110614_c0_g1_i1.p1  ORF type:complete len:211 (-),score=20.65 TRINITY_DN110614_c0_g1_i1:228-860(-)
MELQVAQPDGESGKPFGSLVELNVGGFLFTSSLTTLTRYKDSMLASLFSGQWKISKDGQGRCFIDRDGSLFGYILNFLRDSTLELPSDFSQFGQLLREAEFYQVEPLILAVQAAKQRRNNPVHIYFYHRYSDNSYTMEGPLADVRSFGLHVKKRWMAAGVRRGEIHLQGDTPITDILDALASRGYTLIHTQTSTVESEQMYCEYFLRCQT